MNKKQALTKACFFLCRGSVFTPQKKALHDYFNDFLIRPAYYN